MKLPQSQIVRRDAFTLIELLVVITIIAILVSLLLAAIFKALAVVSQVQNRNDISQLESAIANFKQDFQVDYLPSSIAAGDPFYTRMSPLGGAGWGPTLGGGNQCLVFFLGGLNQQGFSSDPSNPLAPAFPGEVRKGPYFDFRANRLVGGQYLDVYGTPFAYYSTTGTPNTYPAGAPVYMEAGGNAYIKPDTFQLISAGPNKQFGPGGVWPGNVGMAGADDISNFAVGPLGGNQ